MKKKKIKDVEFWTQALKEEEKIAIELYCSEKGEQEMQLIQKAILDRHNKELNFKKTLESSKNAFEDFK